LTFSLLNRNDDYNNICKHNYLKKTNQGPRLSKGRGGDPCGPLLGYVRIACTPRPNDVQQDNTILIYTYIPMPRFSDAIYAKYYIIIILLLAAIAARCSVPIYIPTIYVDGYLTYVKLALQSQHNNLKPFQQTLLGQSDLLGFVSSYIKSYVISKFVSMTSTTYAKKKNFKTLPTILV